jgi:hypothetical protein
MGWLGGRDKVGAFWRWFGGVAERLAADVENPTLLAELGAKVSELDPALSWEVGPGETTEWQLVISPNLDRDLRELAARIVAQAPAVPGWQFHSARRPKNWEYKFDLETADGVQTLDASSWRFVLLQYPDGAREIVLEGPGAAKLAENDRRQAAAIALESILGEEVLIDHVDDFDFVSTLEPEFAGRARPIQQLNSAVLGQPHQ